MGKPGTSRKPGKRRVFVETSEVKGRRLTKRDDQERRSKFLDGQRLRRERTDVAEWDLEGVVDEFKEELGQFDDERPEEPDDIHDLHRIAEERRVHIDMLRDEMEAHLHDVVVAFKSGAIKKLDDKHIMQAGEVLKEINKREGDLEDLVLHMEAVKARRLDEDDGFYSRFGGMYTEDVFGTPEALTQEEELEKELTLSDFIDPNTNLTPLELQKAVEATKSGAASYSSTGKYTLGELIDAVMEDRELSKEEQKVIKTVYDTLPKHVRTKFDERTQES